jgi:hypothetical protein
MISQLPVMRETWKRARGLGMAHPSTRELLPKMRRKQGEPQ